MNQDHSPVSSNKIQIDNSDLEQFDQQYEKLNFQQPLSKKTEGSYVNGRGQVVEILKNLDSDHKNRLLKLMKIKNPGLVQELNEQCLSFEDLEKFSTSHLSILISYVSAPIFGMSLRCLGEEAQRTILEKLPRGYAEKCFDYMIGNESGNFADSNKAKIKVLQILKTLIGRKEIIPL